MRKMNSEKRFRMICLIILLIFTAICVAPFLLMVAASVTDENALIAEGYRFWPSKFSFNCYKYLWLKRETISRAYLISIFVTVVGTLVNITITSLFAYPLARKDFKWRNTFAFLVFFTMLFNGGLVATYISYVTIFHVKNTIFGLIVPNLLMNAFNIMLVRNYFSHSIPEEIYESARIDGASEFVIFFKLVLPLSVPILATVGLMSGIAYWNDWQNALYYIDDKSLYTVQAVLNAINESVAMLASLGGTAGASAADLPSTTIRMAVAVVGIFPVLVAYPFFQKYFAAGLMAGSVKG